MSDLVAFLRARLDEDEHDRRRLASIRGGVPVFIEGDGEPIMIAGARLLAEVEAKRRIVELAEEATGLDMQVDNEFRVGSRDLDAEPYVGDLILRLLALPYAGHPEYQAEWKP